ncbi:MULTISPECIES: xanthine dehydrogenase family protein molybdopterin-binding subunit [Chroococcidiopsis]|jgi:aerobic carbon-monoxide dehydrogenase large subunit|uniref:Xanthine dehydrogenase, molybdenum binding subunit apoprotein n=1 Tax=Chroococcidiopsis thermalis (strain PCC 7203) TaxID=251229 RepID=K9U1N8_CHRTP|nr:MULTISPECIES: molybdopterin cofactor-binding domain-containing protein [Chroococcidiopsis]AFY88745.1 xanthine dehydrogenase, molybdenum binding subunit apoprotein [Chroococcidiopsis thermalis PCC 7203]PSB47440.1 aldehyde oxidase [Cyanosarcina cf. burmensis CCALA 770]URD48063.1 molybdopterin-dependent oxidoreductase [Chroococcidiopsis sp. CCNUC1]
MANKILGTSVKRREDPELLRGEAKFTADITLPNMLHMAILHSDRGHALIQSIDTSAAERMPGVVRVITGADTSSILPLPCIMNPGGAESRFPSYPYGLPGAQTVLATDRVRYIGEFVAVVVALTRQQAYDALPAIAVKYEPLSAVVNAEEALQPDAPQLHDTVPNNLNQYISHGNKQATEQAIANAEVVVKQRIRYQRAIHNPVELRASIGDYNPETEEYTLWTNTQIPHGNRFLLSQLVMGIPYNKLRVIAPHIGGGFGSKGYLYPDTALVLFLSKELGQPVKWVDTRRGLARSTVQARDQIQYVTIAGTTDGQITALHCTNYANLGAYPATNGPGAPAILTGCSITGVYAIAHPFYEVYCTFTNLVPNGPARGAGRAEAIFLIERMVDLFAQRIGIDPAEVRRKNMVAADRFPYKNGLGWTYDSGNYEVALDKALATIDYNNVAQRKAEARTRGKRLGVGIGSYVAIAGVGPCPLMARDIGLNGSTWGSAHIRVHPTGDITLITGAQPHGQGQVTSFSQIIAEELGVDLEQIEVLHSDTKGTIYAQGSYGSRSFSVEGATVYKATQKIDEKARQMAAHIFKVAESEVVADRGKFYVKGAPEQFKTLKEIALALWYAWDLPAGMEPGLEAIAYFDPPDFNYPFGTHIALVEIDEQTGQVEVVRYVAVDDFGNVGNPMIVDGQTHGNIHFGISQALFEEAVYDRDGRILTDEFTTYAIAKASQLPKFELDRTVTPTPHNPLGAKGAGDVSITAVPPAIVNAVCNALSDLGVTHIDMPVTPEKVWRVMRETPRNNDS